MSKLIDLHTQSGEEPDYSELLSLNWGYADAGLPDAGLPDLILALNGRISSREQPKLINTTPAV